MEGHEDPSKDSERRKLQEDIERLQDVIGDDEFNSDDDSDNDILQIDIHSTTQTEADEDLRQTPGGISSCPGSVIPTEDDDDRDEIIINLNENIPIDPDTCLALNKAYQEVLLDTLRSIEMALIENRDKQDKITENLCIENPTKKSKNKDLIRRTVSSYQRPFFMDDKGHIPTPNNDVLIKRSTDEQRQDVKPAHPWRKKQKNALKEAVYLDSLDQQTRPLMNRKELHYEKLSRMSKEANGEEYEKLAKKIDELDEEITKLVNLPQDEVINIVDPKRIDWMKISNTTLNNIRDPTECELFWNNILKPAINKKEWTKAEKEKLAQLAEIHDQKNWAMIAKELGTNRTAFQCLQFYQQNLNDVFNKRPWTEIEDQMLLEVVENCRVGQNISWTQVSYFIEGRSSFQCTQRWTQINPEIKRGKWSEEEDMKLLAAIFLYGDKDFEQIAKFVPNRSVLQCRERYKSSLDPNLRPADVWTYEEDKQMLIIIEELRKEDGKIPWAKVAERMEGRSDNMILCRHKKLMEWKEKCAFLESQDPKQKIALGYIDIEELAKGDTDSVSRLRKSKDPEMREKQETTEYRRLSQKLSKLPVAEYKLDYIKQLKDKREGNLVVPRPPLMYRYTRRNTTNVWARKKQMKALLETHLSKLHITNAEDRLMIPAKTAEEFKPFSSLNEKQMVKIQKVLQTKNPCEISVKELLALTSKAKKNIQEMVANKKEKKNRIEALIDNRICDILQYKHCYITKWRKPSGRPKKFYIFYPGGRKPTYAESENTVQLSTVTSTLLFNALEIDGKKAIDQYQTLIPKKKKALKQLHALLCKCFPQIPSSVTKVSTTNTSTHPGQVVTSAGTIVSACSSTVTMTAGTTVSASSLTVAMKSSSSSNNSLQNSLDNHATSKRKGSQDSGGPKRKRGRPSKKSKTNKDEEDENETEEKPKKSDESMSKIINNIVETARRETNVQSSSDEISSSAASLPGSPNIVKVENSSIVKKSTRKRKSTDKQNAEISAKILKSSIQGAKATEFTPPVVTTLPKIIPLNNSSLSGVPVPTALVMNSAGNKSGVNTMVLPNMVGANTLKPGQKLPASNPRVIVIRQPPSAAGSNKFPILPPSVTTLRGYEEFLIQSNLLKSRAGDMYNPFFYCERAKVLETRLDVIRQEKPVVSRLNFNDKVDRALECGAKKVNAVLGGKRNQNQNTPGMIHPKKDLLMDVRSSPDYLKLKKRFEALFLWPAFLSLLQPEKENVFDKQQMGKKLVTFEEWMEEQQKMEQGNNETINEIPDGIKIEKDGGSKKKYPLARGRLFAKYRAQYRKKRAMISMKRRLAKQMQMKSIQEKGYEKIRAERKAKEEERKRKVMEKYKHLGQRSSDRIMQKKNTPITSKTEPEVKVKKAAKLRSLKSLTREMEKGKKQNVSSSGDEADVHEDKTKKDKHLMQEYQDNNIVAVSPEKTKEQSLETMLTQAPTATIPAGFSLLPQNQGGVFPVMMLPNVGAAGSDAGSVPHLSGAVSGLIPQVPGMTGGMVPIMLPQQPNVSVQATGQAGGIVPHGMLQPMIFYTPTGCFGSSSAVSPFPLFMVSNISSGGTATEVTTSQATNQSTSIMSSPSQMANFSPKITSVTGMTVSPLKSSAKNPEKDEMSHVFLGTVPGQGKSPMLISVPKDSNMTVKELIQMMGQGGSNSVNTTMGDNSTVNATGDHLTRNIGSSEEALNGNNMGDNSV